MLMERLNSFINLIVCLESSPSDDERMIKVNWDLHSSGPTTRRQTTLMTNLISQATRPFVVHTVNEPVAVDFFSSTINFHFMWAMRDGLGVGRQQKFTATRSSFGFGDKFFLSKENSSQQNLDDSKIFRQKFSSQNGNDLGTNVIVRRFTWTSPEGIGKLKEFPFSHSK